MIDKPNVVLPLAHSYNERGVQGYTHAVTNGEDQRKVNCFYEPVKNNMTGKGTLTLSKRPGVAEFTHTAGSVNSFGGATQNVYLVYRTPTDSISFGTNIPSIIFKDGNDIRTSTGGGNSWTVYSSTADFPGYIDMTTVSDNQYAVLQTKNTDDSFGHRAWYSVIGSTWTEITDVDFTNQTHVGKMEHLDGYAFILNVKNDITNSDLNSLANWTATNFLKKNITVDIPIGLAKFGKQILAFGFNTVEMFYNAGHATGSPLSTLGHLSQRIGLIIPHRTLSGSGHYYCTVGSRMYFIGRSGGGEASASVYTYNGQGFEKVSNNYIDKILSEVATTSYYSMNSLSFHGRDAVAILITNPNSGSTQRWLMFFPEWKEWFEWTSDVFNPISMGGYFLSSTVGAKHLLYRFTSLDNWQDDGTSYQWLTQFRLPSNGGSRNRMIMYGLDADTDTSANSVTVDVSDDDCQSFYNLGSLDLTRDRKMGFRGGSFRKRHVRLSATDARPKRVYQFLARVDG